MFIFLLALLLFVLIIVVPLIIWTIANTIPPVPSSSSASRIMLSLIRENADEWKVVTERPLILELGSGWGNFTIAAAKALPDCAVQGYENSPVPYLFSRLAKRIAGCRNLTFVRADFKTAPLEEASCIVCYLHPGAMKAIKENIEKSIVTKPLYIVSNTFHIPGWEPLKVYTAKDLYRSKIYLYKVRYA